MDYSDLYKYIRKLAMQGSLAGMVDLEQLDYCKNETDFDETVQCLATETKYLRTKETQTGSR